MPLINSWPTIELEVVGHVIGVNRGTRFQDIFQNGVIVAMNQVRQVRANLGTGSMARMAFSAACSVIKKDATALEPLAASELWNIPLSGIMERTFGWFSPKARSAFVKATPAGGRPPP
jgi:hypothetical protein